MTSFIPTPYEICVPDMDRSAWNPKLAQFYGYWLSIKPGDGLPGRQHFDPLDIPLIMPRVWMLDVLRDPLRYRYRLAGTKEVETLQHEVTGKMFTDVHPQLSEGSPAFERLNETVRSRIVSYRKGPVVAIHDKKHQTVENCIVPLAGDGSTVDILVACSVLYTLDGHEN